MNDDQRIPNEITLRAIEESRQLYRMMRIMNTLIKSPNFKGLDKECMRKIRNIIKAGKPNL